MPAKRKKPTSNVKTAKRTKPVSKLRGARGSRQIDTSALWRQPRFDRGDWAGLQVWVPIDPYTSQERLDFRAAMENPYIYRANWIISKLVAGQGYTTDIVPRAEEEIESDQLDQWKQTEIDVPFFGKKMTPQKIQDFVDKISIQMDLPEQIFNGYLTSREQGRCVLGLTPIDRDEQTEDWQLPDSIRLIRPEFTLRPFLDHNTAELIGVQIVGLTSNQQFILPAERMIYIENGFNNQLFSDHYGVSQVSRVTDCANVLNLIYADDFLHAAEATWHQPKVFGVPIQPQDFGDESTILDDFLSKNANAKGQDIAVVLNPDGEGGVKLLSSSTNSGDISGLETIVVRCIKVVLAYYNLPGFMLSEGDSGSLGGNSNMEEIDMFINAEIVPERIKLENMVEKQFYDRILAILFHENDPNNVPLVLKHKFNKPKLASIFRADLYEMGKDMVAEGLMDKDGLIEMLGLEQFQKEKITYTEGADPTPNERTWIRNRWSEGQQLPVKMVWEAMPQGWVAPHPWSNQHGAWPQQEVRGVAQEPHEKTEPSNLNHQQESSPVRPQGNRPTIEHTRSQLWPKDKKHQLDRG